MKQFSFWAAAALALGLAACAGERGAEKASTALVGDTLKIDTALTVKQWRLSVKQRIFYPSGDSTALTQNVREWINEQLGGTYAGSLANGRAVMGNYVRAWVDSNRVMVEQMPPLPQEPGGEPVERGMEWSVDAVPVYETDKLVSYQLTSYSYLGGAHGLQASAGATFRKSDGRRFGWEIFRPTTEQQLSDLIKKGLMKYFQVTTDEALGQLLFDANQVYAMPTPATPPVLTKDGIVVTYQHYEIAPYAAGMPTCTLSYKDVEPLLTATARQLIGAQ